MLKKTTALLAAALATASCAGQKAPADHGDTVVSAAHLDDAAKAVAASALPASDRGAFARFVAANRKRPEAYDGKTVRQIVNFEISYENGLAAVAAGEARAEANGERLRALLDARVTGSRDADRWISFDVTLRDKSAKAIRHVDLELEIDDATTKRRVGEIELNVDHAVHPHATVAFAVPVRYSSFGSATGTMLAAAHHRKTFDVRPDHIVYADGSDVGIEGD